MSCDICKHEHSRADVLCQPCRETMVRLIRICRTNPGVLSSAQAAQQAATGTTWWAGAAGARI